MKMPANIEDKMLAPCGMNCLVCYVFLKEKNNCKGCLENDECKPKSCHSCKIKNCAAEKNLRYCFECLNFPCTLINNLEKSYTKRYNISLIKNSLLARENGLSDFLAAELTKWECKICSGIVSLHDCQCSECKTEGYYH